ncbi:acyl-CoA dehydrogenase [Halobacteriales archaeon QS_8_69_26]|nr:MAG: acyl-CoA dehydrogenase [Halobacteriales archaeon QS_8_69_26]
METHGGVSFDTDEEAGLILDSLGEFLEREVAPVEEDLGDLLTNPRKGVDEDGNLDPAVVDAIEGIRRASAKAGFYAMNLPEDVGGSGVSNVTWYRAKRRVARDGSALAEYALAGPEGPKPLLLNAEGDQVDRYLEPTVRGEKSTAFALTEPGVGSDAPNMATTARRVGEKAGDGSGAVGGETGDDSGEGDDAEDDAEWILDGQKQWITNAPHADFVQVFARTTPAEETGRYGGITCFLVEDDEYEVGSLNNAVGLEGMQAELHFDELRLPPGRVLGTVDGAFYEAMNFLGLGRMELGATAVGRSRFLRERCEDYATEREAFGRPIGEFQQISSKIARGYARTEAADALGLRCAWELDRGGPAIEETSAFKWFATNAFWDVADDAVQVHGSTGVSEDAPFVDNLHLARVLRIVEGTDEIQLNTIARQRGIL